MNKFMIKTLPFILLFLITTLASAQKTDRVDYKAIEKVITNKKSTFYYPELLNRYQAGDKDLTIDELRALYYGFTFQTAYRPYDRNPLDQEIANLMGAGIDENREELIEKAEQYLIEQPFNLRINYYLQNFLTADDEHKLNILKTQFNGVIKAILSSGSGQTIETGYSVNLPTDEYYVLQSIGLTHSNYTTDTTYDYFTITENTDNIKGIYFDVYQMAKIGTEQLGIETVEVYDEEIPEDGVEIGSEEEMFSFIPLGYEILTKIKTDFDKDEDEDWVIVLAKEAEELLSNAAAGDPEPRILLLLSRGNDGLLTETLRSETAIPCIDCGGANQDPFVSLTAHDGELNLVTKGGGLFVWERESNFKWKKDSFYLTKEQFKSYRKGKKDQAQTDVETKKEFGKITLQEFDFYQSME